MAKLKTDPISLVSYPRLKRDWEGRHVRLRIQMETNGGEIFERGEGMQVRRNFGGLELQSVRVCKECNRRRRRIIKNVRERDVVLLPKDFKP